MTTIWDRQYEAGDGLRWWPETELVRFIGRKYGRTYGGPKAGSERKALDLGCGTGRNAWLLYESGFIVNAIDQSLEAVKLAREYINGKYRTSSVYVDHLAIPGFSSNFKKGVFDLVIDCQTIQHLTVTQHFDAYCEIFKLLKPGGTFWSMHYESGDAAEVFPDHPELKETHYPALADPMSKIGFNMGECNMIMRSYQDSKKRIFWLITEWSKP